MLACVVMPSNLEAHLTTLFRDESAVSRAVDFNSSFIATTNLLGDAPKYKLTDWALEVNALRLPKRALSWYEALTPRTRADAPEAEQAEKTSALKQPIKHDQVEINSLIRDSLWNRAKWVGVGFVQFANVPCPALCLLFSDKEASVKIFELWRQDLTPHDASDRLRIALVRRFNKDKPLAYRVVVGSNVGAMAVSLKRNRRVR
jgi:hypothetical protein